MKLPYILYTLNHVEFQKKGKFRKNACGSDVLHPKL